MGVSTKIAIEDYVNGATSVLSRLIKVISEAEPNPEEKKILKTRMAQAFSGKINFSDKNQMITLYKDMGLMSARKQIGEVLESIFPQEELLEYGTPFNIKNFGTDEITLGQRLKKVINNLDKFIQRPLSRSKATVRKYGKVNSDSIKKEVWKRKYGVFALIAVVLGLISLYQIRAYQKHREIKRLIQMEITPRLIDLSEMIIDGKLNSQAKLIAYMTILKNSIFDKYDVKD